MGSRHRTSSHGSALAHSLVILCVLGVAASSARAQDVVPIGRPSAVAVQLPDAPVLDGNVLTDERWLAVQPVDGAFVQKNPFEGAPARERTELRIAYTATALYVGVVCFDGDPEGIIVSGARRDSSLDDTDSVRFIVDTYRDGQNGFVFGTNPAGLEYDAQVVNEGQGGGGGPGGQQGGSGGGFNLNWDGSWRVVTRVHDEGWTAEFEIPFRTLRYPSRDVQTWGLNFERRTRRYNETAYWAPLPRQFDIARVSMAGTLDALRVPPQRNLKIIPYALGVGRDDSRHPDVRLRGEPGVDLKYSLTPSLTLDATVNTDFAQVEVDEQQVNLDRFTLFFPEKRPFFLENAGLFAVGSSGEAEVFFTRRIGISPEGREIPIVGGVRLSGQAGRGLNVGFLNMQTEEVPGIAPAHNFTVGRLRQDLPNRSSVGVIAVNRETTSGPGGQDYHRSFAADARWGLGASGLLSGFVAMTTTPGVSGDEHAYQISARRDGQRWELSAGFTEVGRNFKPEVGFLARSGGFRKPEFLVFHRYRPRDFLRLQEVRPHVSYRGYWKPDGFQESGFLHVDSHWEFRSAYEVHTGVNFVREGVRAPFEIAGVPVLPGTYDSREAQIVAMTNQGAPYSLSLRTTIGGFFGGDRIAVSPTLTMRFTDTFNAELSLSRNDVDLPTGSFTTNVARTRVSYSFTARTFLQGLVQYNDTADLWSANVRFGWLQQANTGLFIVYNDTQPLDDDPRSRSVITGRSLTIKVSRMIDLLR